jgi:hypothetical protein
VKFNLLQFRLNEFLRKEAFSQPQRLRENYEWWDYEEVSASDPSWSEWASVDPSLNEALSVATQQRQKHIQKLERIYGLGPGEVNKIYKTYLGYHPRYGAYVCWIGPYLIDDKYTSQFAKEDTVDTFRRSVDTFGFFIRKKRKTTQEEMLNSVLMQAKKYMEKYNVEIDASDLQLIVKTPAGQYDPSRRGQPQNVVEVITRLDAGNPEADDLYARAPIVGDNSEIKLNAKGLEKIISGQWGRLYQNVIREESASRNMTPEQVRRLEISDLGFLQSVYEKIRTKYNDAVQSGDAVIEGMSPPPSFNSISYSASSGQQVPTTLGKMPQEITKQLRVRKELLTLLNQGLSTPEEIAGRLNQNVQRGEDRIPVEEVQERLDAINRLTEENNVGYEQLINDTNAQIEGFEEKYGFKDLKTAFEMARLYFTQLPVDKSWGAKHSLPLKYAPKMVFDPPENFENVTSQDLAEMREKTTAVRSGEEISGEDAGEATETEIEKDIGKAKKKDKSKNKDKVQEDVPPMTVPTEEEPKLPAEPEELELPKGLLSKTIQNLIKISAELDAQHKKDAAEEIHKVIRKYQERIF